MSTPTCCVCGRELGVGTTAWVDRVEVVDPSTGETTERRDYTCETCEEAKAK